MRRPVSIAFAVFSILLAAVARSDESPIWPTSASQVASAQVPPAGLGSAESGVSSVAAVTRTASDALSALRGELLIRHHRCASCHAAPAGRVDRYAAPSAPDLSAVASRITPNWLRLLISDPQGTHPGSTMPGLLAGYPEQMQAELVEDLTHFLGSLGTPFDASAEETDRADIERGKSLFHTKGCVACHLPKLPANEFDDELGEFKGDFDPLAAAGVVAAGHGGVPRGWVPLPELDRKTNLDSLVAFLLDPREVRPAGRMPSLMLSEKEAQSLARYLLVGDAPPEASREERFPGLWCDYYETQIDGKTPDFDALERVRRTPMDQPGMSFEHRPDHFAVRIHGWIRIEQEGEYTFFTNSDDGSLLFIDDEKVVDNEGTHGMREVSGKVQLGAGDHHIVVTMFEQGGGEGLKVHWQGPGIGKQEIPATVLYRTSQVFTPTDPGELALDPERVARGRKSFTTLGCAQCHGLEIAPPAAGSKPRPLAALNLASGSGCLGAAPGAGVPSYALSTADRAALGQTIAALSAGTVAPLTDADRVVRTMAELNCYACHERDGVGGPNESRVLYFTNKTQVDMGVEGRVPPPLNGVGGKLRKKALRDLLVGDVRMRPHMATVMPSYGEEHVGDLTDLLDRVDAVEGDMVEAEFDQEMLETGRMLLGAGGLSCIECHSFAGFPSLGIPAGDLAESYPRLRPGWFRRYLKKPFKVRPGTRMPSYFAEGDVSLPEVLGGDADKQIDALWTYLSMGASAPLPKGLKVPSGTYQLIATDAPVLVGVFMQGVSPRTVCVGFPERAHYAFDTQGCRLAKLWRGEFFNAEGTWNGRAGKLESPAGSDVRDLPAGGALAVLDAPDASWPEGKGREAGYRWKGRDLDDQKRPIFRYQFGDLMVRETLWPELRRGGSVLYRSIEVRAPAPIEGLYFRAAVGGSVTLDEAGHEVAGFGTVISSGDLGGAFVTGKELRYPVQFKADGDGFVARCEVMLQW